MATKTKEKKNANSCLNKAHPDEPLFVLRGQDVSSPKVVLHWIAKNFESASEFKLREAFDIAMKMREWVPRKSAD
jgi:hypothetical protein